MTAVELIYDADCPNVQEARAQLMRALSQAGLPPRWQEWDRGDPASPPHVRSYGSPTILVNGDDVANAAPSDGADCCRVYAGPGGRFQGVPSVEAITDALKRNESAPGSGRASGRKRRWAGGLLAIPGIGLALLPSIACPVCWPAYAGLLGSLGLGFLVGSMYLLPLSIVFLALAVGVLFFRARVRRGYGPFVVGVLASAVILVGKFVLDSAPATYGGIALLVAASVWNSWPRKAVARVACPACLSSEGPVDGGVGGDASRAV